MSVCMPYAFLGNSGLKVSRIGYGAWVSFGTQVDEELAYKIIKKAIDNGVNFFDNAEVYNHGVAETIMGNVFKRLNLRRSSYVITTKIFWGNTKDESYPNDFGLSRKHIIEGLTESLKRLQLDYVDVVYAHRPDMYTPIEETVRAFNYVINKGMALYWGTSEWSGEQVREAIISFFKKISKRLGLICPIVEQPQYNMLHREKVEKEYLRLYETDKLGLTIWSPLASGVLTGKYNNGIPEGSRLNLGEMKSLKDSILNGTRFGKFEDIQSICKELKVISDKLGCTQAQLALAWVLKNEIVSVMLLGATKVEQLEENIKCLEVLPKLTDDIMEEIEKILKNKPTPFPDCRTWIN